MEILICFESFGCNHKQYDKIPFSGNKCNCTFEYFHCYVYVFSSYLDQTLNSDLYWQLLTRLKQAIDQKGPKLANSLLCSVKITPIYKHIFKETPEAPGACPGGFTVQTWHWIFIFFSSNYKYFRWHKLASREANENVLVKFFANTKTSSMAELWNCLYLNPILISS